MRIAIIARLRAYANPILEHHCCLAAFGFCGTPKAFWHQNRSCKINGSYVKTRRITMPQGTLTSRELIDQREYLSGQTIEPLLETRDDYEVYLAYVEE